MWPFILPIILAPIVGATVFLAPFQNCLGTTAATAGALINISTVYAQMVSEQDALTLGLPGGGSRVLRLDMVGATGSGVIGFDNTTGKLATMFTTTSSLSYNLYSTTTYVCNSLFPPSPLPTPYFPYNTTYCPIPAGPLALNLSIPLENAYSLSTLSTNIKIVDTAVPPNTLLCITVMLSPYYPQEWPYKFFLWLPAALAISYWVSSWAARFAAGWVVGSMGHGDGDGEVGWGRKGGRGRKWGTMVISGLSGERLGVSGGLLRFVTPGLKDIIHHLQFCAVLGMVAVQWPGFAYPILAKGAWASLIWNVALVQGQNASSKLIDVSHIPPTTFPTAFASQMNTSKYPLYLSSTSPAPFLNLAGAAPGMESFAAAVGLRTMDLYGTNVVLFLCLGAGIFVLSLLIWVLHGVLTSIIGTDTTRGKRGSWGPSPRESALAVNSESKRIGTPETPILAREQAATSAARSPQVGAPGKGRRLWWRFKIKGPVGAYHWNALCGNLVRILILFHLPLTVFSVYQWTIKDQSPVAVTVLAALSFAVFSILIPVYLLIRVATTATAKLYDATRTLLSLGPLYNIYAQGSQLYPALTFASSLAMGITVGAGQKSGTAQAIVLLVIEIAMAVVTTIWQPWGGGSGMGVPGALFQIVRVISLVLLLVLSPAIAIESSAVGWVAYVLIGLQGFIFLVFLVMLLCKILEGLIRLFGQLKFDESKHPLDGGLYAAFVGLSSESRKARKNRRQSLQRSTSSGAGSTNTQMMLDKHSTQRTTPISPEVQYFQSMGGFPLDHEAEYMRSNTPSTSRGFSVLGGGKANYEMPYDVVSGNEGGQAPYTRPPSSYGAGHPAHANDPYSGHASITPVNQPGPSRLSSPVTPGVTPAVRHGRTKSQTAIIETLPTTVYPPTEYAPGPSKRAPPVPLALQRIERDDRSQRDSSPTSAYSSESIPVPESKQKRTSKPSTWFGKPNKNEGQWSDSEEEATDFGPKGKGRAGTEPGRSAKAGTGGWLSALKVGKSSTTPTVTAPADERRVDENAVRKSWPPGETEMSNLPRDPERPENAPKKSFQVNRPGRPGGNQAATGGSTVKLVSQSTPPPISLGPPIDAAPTSPPTRSFVVSRPGHARGPSAPTNIGVITPPEQHSPINDTPSTQARSFVVNRPQRPVSGNIGLPEPVGYTPLTGYESDRSNGSNAPPRPERSARRSYDQARASLDQGRI